MGFDGPMLTRAGADRKGSVFSRRRRRARGSRQ
jgi:hypothetical protein